MPIKNDSVKERLIYVMELEGGNFYIGQTVEHIAKRVRKHFMGKGSAWTKAHAPKSVKKVINIGLLTYTEAEQIENEYVIQYMKKYGWEKVRGGFFTLVDEEQHLKTLRGHQRLNKVNGIDFI